MEVKQTKNTAIPTRVVYKDLIRDTIYDALVNGELNPGDHIVEMDWSKKFNVSQAPVREAIRELESRGVVETIPFKGTFVREMTVQNLKDIHQVRSGLEAVALKNAIVKATDEQVEQLKHILDEMKQYAEEGNATQFLEKDISFHEYIVDLANTTELKKMWDLCNIRLWTAFNISMSTTELKKYAETHDVIYEVLRDRKLELAFSVMVEHFDEVVSDVFEM